MNTKYKVFRCLFSELEGILNDFYVTGWVLDSFIEDSQKWLIVVIKRL